MREEWIEIGRSFRRPCNPRSPPVREEWIEITHIPAALPSSARSPPVREEWIEIRSAALRAALRWSPPVREEWIEIRFAALVALFRARLLPCGRSGLKFYIFVV